MTWDEKYLARLGTLELSEYGDRETCVIRYGDTVMRPLPRYWLLGDGMVLKWGKSTGQWFEIGSPRVRRAILMRAWPEWVPTGVPKGRRRFYVPSNRKPDEHYVGLTFLGGDQMNSVAYRIIKDA